MLRRRGGREGRKAAETMGKKGNIKETRRPREEKETAETSGRKGNEKEAERGGGRDGGGGGNESLWRRGD